MKKYFKERRLAECAVCLESSKEKNKSTLYCNWSLKKEPCSKIKDCGCYPEELCIKDNK